MYIDLSALPLTLLKRFDTNVHTVITSMQKNPNMQFCKMELIDLFWV